jgi:hypothetical protein
MSNKSTETIRDSQPSVKKVVPLTYRFVICVDVDATSLENAYNDLYDSMKEISSQSLEWESTDEAYFPDGEEVDPIILQKARLSKLSQND